MYGTLCTEFYDLDKHFASADEINFYQSLFHKDDLILEPMCGSGRLLIPLMKAGFTLHGLDNSKAMLDSCKKRASQFGLNPILFQENIETALLSHQYDGIIVPFGSLQLFPRMSAYFVLEKFKTILKPGGKLIMDLFVPLEFLSKTSEEKIQREVIMNENTVIKLDSHSVYNKFEQFILMENTYEKLLNGKVISQEKEKMHINWYYRYEMELILEKYGFKKISCQERFLNNESQMTFVISE